MHTNQHEVAQQGSDNAAAAQNAANAAQALQGTNKYLGQYYGNLGTLNQKNQTMDPELQKNLGILYGSSVSAGNAGTTEDVENLARRTGENSGAYAGIISEDRRARTRDANTNMARADIQDSTDRAQRLIEIGKMYGLGPDVLSRIYGSGVGAQSANLGHATTAAGGTETKSPWADILQSAISGAATVGGAAVAPKPTGCWIAEAIYGVDDSRTYIVRAWLNLEFARDGIGKLIMRAYLKYGERVAAIVRKSSLARAALRPLFDAALSRAMGWIQRVGEVRS